MTRRPVETTTKGSGRPAPGNEAESTNGRVRTDRAGRAHYGLEGLAFSGGDVASDDAVADPEDDGKGVLTGIRLREPHVSASVGSQASGETSRDGPPLARRRCEGCYPVRRAVSRRTRVPRLASR